MILNVEEMSGAEFMNNYIWDPDPYKNNMNLQPCYMKCTKISNSTGGKQKF